MASGETLLSVHPGGRRKKNRLYKMPHLEKVLAHAQRQLADSSVPKAGQLAAQLPLYKKFLKIENHRLHLAHHAGGGGLEICHRRVSLLDIFLRQLFEDASKVCLAGDGAQPAMVAIGGYGRGELNPYSDVDILFLHDFRADKVPGHISEFIKQILYVLWDIGFKVGHSTRSIREACEHANRDNISKTALLEARYLAGPETLVNDFKRRFDEHCVEGQENAYLAWRQQDQQARHLKYGPTVFLQEPNVKSSPGGLRDYHNMLWSTYFKERAANIDQITERQFINQSERRTLEQAHDFILRVRTDLHYLAKRSADTLVINYQSQIADRFKYPQDNVMRRTEAFMRDYYQHARTISLITEMLFERLLEEGEVSSGARPAGGLMRFFTRKASTDAAPERFDGFVVQGGLIYAEARDVFNQDPFRLMRVFEHAQTRGLPLSSELQQLIRRRVRLVNRTFQYARLARESFTAILSRKGQVARILRAMHEVDLLGAYMPEFGDLTCLVQHEFFHRYSADEHTLVCIEKLDALLDPANTQFAEYRKLFEKVEDPFVLYLALLLHDTGKATSARHHSEASALFAQKVAARLQLSPERRRALILLVDHHMTLSSTAQRRNLDDPETIAEFAMIVKDRPTLDALMLLTFADGQGVSDAAWSDWKESLVWQLYRSARSYLAEGEAGYLLNRRERESQRRAVATELDASYAEETDAHFQHMPDRYFETFDAPAIAEHMRLMRAFLVRNYEHKDAMATLAPVIRWRQWPERGHTECWVCTWERRRLFAKIAGSFSAAGLNILSADIYTRGDNLVFDVFRVSAPQQGAVIEPRDLAAVEDILRQSLQSETFDFEPLLQKARRRRRSAPVPVLQELGFPTRTVITNEATSRHTLLEVQTPDRLGLLYNLLRALSKQNVNVVLSRIATEMGAAIDSFYLTDREGERITDPATMKKIQTAVQQAATKT
jgi:[protein-PII] uridylyltransferase